MVNDRLAGKEPDGMVVISFTGSVPLEFVNNPMLLARPDQEYDWRFVAGLSVCLLVKSGLPKIAKTMLDIAMHIRPGQLSAWDVERLCGCDLGAFPTLETVGRPRTQWRWQLDVCPWIPWQNKEFLR